MNRGAADPARRERLLEHLQRLSWSAGRLRRERERRLRDLLRAARARSPWHRRRLAHLDPDTVTEADLARCAPMTKADLMAHWDEIVTDPRLSLDRVEAHLARIDADGHPLEGHHAVASSGSTGPRAVFVYDEAAWSLIPLVAQRWSARDWARDPALRGVPVVVASVAGARATHLSSAVAQSFGGEATTCRLPVTLPVERICRELARVQPTVLQGYPSGLYLLAREAAQGRLSISPRRVLVSGEALWPEVRAALQEAWRVPVANQWGTSEGGILAAGCGHGLGMHLSDDLVVVEPVDAAGRPTPPGARSDRVYLTNLFNPVLPLIRYEITDEVVLLSEPCPCRSAHRRVADILGRRDDVFVYAGGLHVHPHVFRTALGRDRRLLEYQVRQRPRGAEVLVRAREGCDLAEVLAEIAASLAALGLSDPDVRLVPVEALPRQELGKVRRFVPLAPAPRG